MYVFRTFTKQKSKNKLLQKFDMQYKLIHEIDSQKFISARLRTSGKLHKLVAVKMNRFMALFYVGWGMDMVSKRRGEVCYVGFDSFEVGTWYRWLWV